MNLDTVANQEDVTPSLKLLSSDLITYTVWKKIDILVKKGKEGVMIKKMKIVDTEIQKEDIKTLFIQKCVEFKKHAEFEINTVNQCV